MILFGYELLTLIIIWIAVFIAGIIRGYSGFGFAMVAVTSMALVLLGDVLASEQGDGLASPKVAKILNSPNWEQLPLLYTPEGEGPDALAQVRLIVPGDRRVWYVSAFDGEDVCFGLVAELELSYDYFTLSELQALRGPRGETIQCDTAFTPQTLRQLDEMYQTLARLGDDGLDRKENSNPI